MAKTVTRKVKARGHTYYLNVPHPSEPDKEIRKSAFATRGQEIEVSEAESKRGDEAGVFFKEGETEQVTEPDGFSVVDASDDELDDYIKENKPTKADMVTLADGDRENAERLMDAEERTRGGDPRVTVMEALEAIADPDGED